MKKGDARRNEIIACAEKLFYQKGYDSTSIQDILDALHLSKGGFYHHFESKLQLLMAISDAKTQTQREEILSSVAECGLDPLGKLNLLLLKALPWRKESMEFFGILLRVGYVGGDVQIRQCLRDSLLGTVRPLLTDIILEGYDQKIFYTRYPQEIGELLLAIYANMNDEIACALARAPQGDFEAGPLLDKLEASRYGMELLLNAPYGSVQIFDMQTLPALLKSIAAQSAAFGEIPSESETPV